MKNLCNSGIGPLLVLILAQLLGSKMAVASVNANLAASRIEGPAPLAVRFDALATTHSNSSIDIFRSLAYSFNFGDSGAGAWEYSGKSKNSELGGPLAAHVYEKPGTYAATVTVTDAYGDTSTASVTIKVQDPNTVYSGENTVCISNNSDFSGAPAGCARIISVPTIESGKRYLFKAGQTFGGIYPSFVNDWQIGRFGSGADPVISSDVKINSFNPGSDTNWATNGVVMNLDVQGAITAEISAENILFLRNKSKEKYSVGTSLEYYFENNTGFSSSAYTWPKNIFIVENTLDAAKIARYGVFGMANGFVVMGNKFSNPIEHNIRSPLTYKGFIAHNYLLNPGSLKHHIKIHSKGLDEFREKLVDTMNPASQYIVVANNKIGNGETLDWSIAVCPMNDKEQHGLQDVIVESNVFNINAIAEVALGGRRLTSRVTNKGNTKVDTTTGCQSGSLTSEWRGPYYVDQDLSIAELSPPTPPLSLIVTVVK